MREDRVSGTSYPRADCAAGRGMPVLGEPQPRGVLFFWTGRGPFVSGLGAAA